MSGGLLGGIILALAGLGISALRKQYPKAMTVIIRTILGLIIAALLIGIIVMLVINGN